MISFRTLSRRTKPLVIGHRGSPTFARENTLDSFEIAINQGADAIELDLRRTADHHLVIHHDPKIARGLPPLAAMTYRRAKHESRIRGFHLPLLNEIIDLCRDRIALNIELKEAGYERELLQSLDKTYPDESILYTSFLPETIARLKTIAPAITTGLLLGVPRQKVSKAGRTTSKGLDHLTDCNADLILPHKLRARTRTLQRLHRQQIPVIVWTVNSRVSFRRLARLGIAGLITDRPDKLRAFLDSA